MTKTTVVVSEKYAAEHERLLKDPIIHALAHGVVDLDATKMVDANGEPVIEFMVAAANEYARRGGKNATSLGGPARAILASLDEVREEEAAMKRDIAAKLEALARAIRNEVGEDVGDLRPTQASAAA